MDRHWLITWTTYGTWLPGDPRGFVSRCPDELNFWQLHNIPGTEVLADEPELLAYAKSKMNGKPFYLEARHTGPLLEQFRETSTHRGWQLCAAAMMRNHVHLVVGVFGDPDHASIIHSYKSYGTRKLNLTFGRRLESSRWTESGSRRKLPDDRARMAGVRYVRDQRYALMVYIDPEYARQLAEVNDLD